MSNKTKQCTSCHKIHPTKMMELHQNSYSGAPEFWCGRCVKSAFKNHKPKYSKQMISLPPALIVPPPRRILTLDLIV